MAMSLIERPGFVFESTPRRRLSTVASAALHAAVALTLIGILRTPPVQQAATKASALIPDVLVLIPNTDTGGGSDRGGDHAIEPPRRARGIGRDQTSTPAPPPSASTISTIEPLEEISALPVKPMGDAMQIIPGVIETRGASAG